LIWFAFDVEGLIVGGKVGVGSIQAEKRFEDLGLMDHFLVGFEIFLVVVGSSLVLVGAEEMVSVGIAVAFLHVVSGNVLQTCPHVSILVSTLIGLIVELFHMLKLRVMAES
jgi:ribose/xylose/arabinose/galactoside ABC-type transport system permease subunit